MEQITLGELGLAITFIVGLFSGISYLKNNLKGWVSSAVKDQIEQVQKDLNGLQKDMSGLRQQIDIVDRESCKNWLVTFLANAEKGVYFDPIEEERFWEEYEHYAKIGGNSYVKTKVEQLKAAGKL